MEQESRWRWGAGETWETVETVESVETEETGVSAGKALSVNELKVVACCFWKQAYTLNVLSCSELGAEFAGLVAGLVPHEVYVG